MTTTPVPVSATYVNPSGAPAVGFHETIEDGRVGYAADGAARVVFTPDANPVTVDGSLVTGPVVCLLNFGGTVEVDLYPSDAPGVSPQGWTYRVRELFAGGQDYHILISTSDTSVNLATCARVAADDGSGEMLAHLAVHEAVPHERPNL